MRMMRRQALGLCGFVSSALLVGCVKKGESQIEKGEHVETGRRNFDEYFEEVSSLREKVDGLDSDLFPLRKPLVEMMELDVDVALGTLLEETKKRVGKFHDYGISLTLQLRPTAQVIEDRGDLEPDQRDESLVKAIEESAQLSMQVFTEYSQLLNKAAELDAQRGELADRIDKLPPTYDKELIGREIVGAGKVLKKTEEKLLRDTRTVSHFLLGLVDAVDTGALAARQTRCEEAIAAVKEEPKPVTKPRPGRPPRPRPAGPRPTAPRPTGPVPPSPVPTPQPPRPKPGGDFEM
jgi:hypothetical protein